MPGTVPEQMRALQLAAFHEDVSEAIRSLKVVTKPVPVPRRGQVLVKVEAAPCNPSDLLFLQARYAQLKTLPAVPGWEGAGTVVASGGGWIARYLQGKRVACSIQGDRDGTWGQYAVAKALECIPLKAGLPIEQGASLIINPLSAMGLLDTARRAGSPRRSPHGRSESARDGCSWYWAARRISRSSTWCGARLKWISSSRSAGRHVLNLSDEGFAEQLREACRKLNATAAFEALAGDMTGTVLQALPSGATVYVYGALSEQPCNNVNPIALIFEGKSITGFFLASWVERRGLWGVLRAADQLQRMMIQRRIETQVQRSVPLDQAIAGLQQYVQMTEADDRRAEEYWIPDHRSRRQHCGQRAARTLRA